MRLRRRLVVAMIVSVAVGVVALDVIVLSSLSSFLYGRVDSQLNVSGHLVASAVVRAEQRGQSLSPGILGSRVGDEVYVKVTGTHGQVLAVHPSSTDSSPDPTPIVPAGITYTPLQARSLETNGAGAAYEPDPSAVSASAGPHGPVYRISAFSFAGKREVLATRLDTVTSTLDSLRTAEVALTAGLLVLLSVLMTVLIRRGLRPLEDMAREADAIAAGDLTRRVAQPGSKSEIASLGMALNGMLAQIETAFDQRRRSEDRLRTFLSDASHELRTPLTAIQGYAELLRKDALRGEGARDRALDRISSEASRMGELVGGLGVLAREGEAPDVELQPVDLAAVAADVVADIRVVAPDHPISFVTSGPCVVAGDAARLEQLVSNLLANATRHTPEGTSVEVSIRQEGPSVRLVVRDDGPGLTADQASHVFDRFWRGNADRLDGGSGLGLSIVASLVRTLGGEVGLETAPGQGAAFTVVLPAHPGASGGGPAATRGVHDARRPEPPGPGTRAGSTDPDVQPENDGRDGREVGTVTGWR